MKLQTFALRLGGGYKRCKLGLLLLSGDRRGRGNSLERIVQATREGLQTRTDKLARRALDLALAWRCGGRTGHRGRRRRATIDRIRVVHEEDTAHRMINANPQLSAAGAAHDVCLDLGVVECGHRSLDAGLDRRGELEQLINCERRVDLRELGQQAREERALKERQVGCICCVGGKGLQQGCDGGAERERVECNFKRGVQLAHGLGREPECTTLKGVPEKACAGGSLGEGEEGHETRTFSLALVVGYCDTATNGHGESGDKDLPCETRELFVGAATHGEHDTVVAAPGGGMIEGVAGHEEDACELFVVVGHHGRSGRLFRHGK
jgi:hypothetical protein